MKPPRPLRGGLTLIELITSLTVFLIVMAALVVVLNGAIDSWRRSRERASLMVAGRAALEMLADDLRAAVVDPTNLFRLAREPFDRQAWSNVANRAEFRRLAADPATNGPAAGGDLRWYVAPTNSLGVLVREFRSLATATNTAPDNRVPLIEGVAALCFFALGVGPGNVPPAELTASNPPPVLDVYLELVTPAEGRRAAGMAAPAREAFIARRALRVATRVDFSAARLPPPDVPADRLCAGRVTDGGNGDQGMAGVRIVFQGTYGTNETYTGADGAYSNTIPSWWTSYAIVPQPPAGRSGVFDPQMRICRLARGDLTGQDFRWTPSDLVISGRVTRAGAGTGIADVTIAFPNAGETETDAAGFYTIGINYGWPYGIAARATPSHPHGGVFDPPHRDYTDQNRPLADQDYTWAPPTIVISGRVVKTDSNFGIVDALLVFSGADAPPPTRTDSYGSYRQEVPYLWTGLVTPGLDPYMAAGGYFEPPNAAFDRLTHDVRQDFTWTRWPVGISGTVYYADTALGVPNVGISFHPNGLTVITRANGTYSAYVPFGWTGTATPTNPIPGEFLPPQRYYDTLTAGVAHQDYRWYPFTFDRRIAGRVVETNSLAPVTNTAIRFLTLRGAASATNVAVFADGTYTNFVSDGWQGVAIPWGPTNGVFVPSSNVYANVTNDWLNQDFMWVP